ncbi:hypothetical protein EHS13_17940 [Paenibacillus psychroresistens]|uniref:Uncharacterized protein n=1 Tax=Paenibacillus psychroresistens TaxID=1778678 RepID=A0A6B8RLU4_9BACL|nr:hypothetical protein [Paenibacillus psychroresistens]QGQ96622.1 hypothetical protein EHS13_17940 [Paenibacillus psychroresistens]
MSKHFRSMLVFAFMICSFIIFGSITAKASSTITVVNQSPYMINDAGTNKTETTLTVTNTDPAYSAWVKISVTGKTAYMESVGSMSTGTNSKLVHVVELNTDGDNVTFAVFDNSGGTGTAKATMTLSQKKIRHWSVFMAHDSHVDIGYIQQQEDLRNTQWPTQTDDTFTYVTATNA